MDGLDLLIGLVFISSICCFIDLFFTDNLKKYIILICLLLFALYCGYYNFPLSADYGVYNMYFNHASSNFEFKYDNDIYDYGFVWLFTLVKSCNGDVMDAYFLVCFITLLLYYLVFKQNTKYIFVAWFLIVARYFYVQNVVQIRQGLACAIMLYSLRYIQQNNKIKFIITLLPAVLIHKTLIVAALLYPLSKINWDMLKIIVALSISFVLYLIPLTDFVFYTIIPSFGIYVPKIASYEGTGYFVPIDFVTVFPRFIYIIVASYILLKCKDEKYNMIYIGMLILSIFVLCMFSDFAVLSERLASIGFLAFTFIPGVCLQFVKGINNKIYMLMMILIVCGMFAVKNLLVMQM